MKNLSVKHSNGSIQKKKKVQKANALQLKDKNLQLLLLNAYLLAGPLVI